MMHHPNIPAQHHRRVKPKNQAGALWLVGLLLLMACCTACGGRARTTDDDAAACDSARAQADASGWLTIEQPEFRLRYPKDWTLQPESESTLFYLYSPSEGESDRFRENISLVVEVLPDGRYDADRYVREAIKLLPAEVNTNERMRRAGREGRRLVYTQRLEGGIVTTNELYVWVIRGKAYLLAFSREVGPEGAQAEAGRRIMQTFEWR